MRQAAEEALPAACRHLGITVESRRRGPGAPTIVIAGVDVHVHGRAVAQAVPRPEYPLIVVADQVGEAARAMLRRAEVGWLDRRGHLYLPMVSPPIDESVPPQPRAMAGAQESDTLGRSRATLEVALDLLMSRQPSGVRPLAREVGLSPGAISMARQRLRGAFLTTEDFRPLTPELFEAVSSVWAPRWFGLSVDPGGHPDPDGEWVRTGDIAAAVLGAPVAVGSAAPGYYYVRSAAVLRAAQRQLGEATAGAAQCWLAVAPSLLAVTRAAEVASNAAPWTAGPVAPAVVVALELARDPGRGREILADWHLEGGSPWRTR